MIINSLYQTQIQCLVNNNECYEVDIDSTDTKVTVSLINFNNIPVPNVDVTLTVDKGHFNTKPDNTTGGTDVVSVTGKTDANGQISAMYSASEFGLVTFRVNTAHAQIMVDGHRMLLETDKFTLYELEDKMALEWKIDEANATGWISGRWSKANANMFNDVYPIPNGKFPVTQMPYFYYNGGLTDDWCYAISFENDIALWSYRRTNKETSVGVSGLERIVYFEWIK